MLLILRDEVSRQKILQRIEEGRGKIGEKGRGGGRVQKEDNPCYARGAFDPVTQ